jgi:hypothetical protein
MAPGPVWASNVALLRRRAAKNGLGQQLVGVAG